MLNSGTEYYRWQALFRVSFHVCSRDMASNLCTSGWEALQQKTGKGKTTCRDGSSRRDPEPRTANDRKTKGRAGKKSENCSIVI